MFLPFNRLAVGEEPDGMAEAIALMRSPLTFHASAFSLEASAEVLLSGLTGWRFRSETPPLSPRHFPLTHLWFLYVLLLCYAAALALRATLGRSDAVRRAADAGVRSLAVVPLRIGVSEGCLLAASDSRRGFSMTDLAALEAVAACAAAASDRMLTPQVEAERAVHELHDSFGQTLRALIANLDRLDEILAASAPQALGEIVRAHALRALRELRGVVDTALRGAPTQGDRTVGMSQLSDELRRSGIA